MLFFFFIMIQLVKQLMLVHVSATRQRVRVLLAVVEK
jgi:hypothetical protein